MTSTYFLCDTDQTGRCAIFIEFLSQYLSDLPKRPHPSLFFHKWKGQIFESSDCSWISNSCSDCSTFLVHHIGILQLRQITQWLNCICTVTSLSMLTLFMPACSCWLIPICIAYGIILYAEHVWFPLLLDWILNQCRTFGYSCKCFH